VKSALLCLCALLVLPACGKKGNPLPPLVRVPAAPAGFAVTRIEDHVYVRMTAPTTNIDGVSPADVARVELYAITLAEPPRNIAEIDPEDLRAASTLIATEQVRRPLPPPPAVKEGMPPIPLPPPGPGVDQGAQIILREALTPEMRTPVSLPEARTRETADVVLDVPRALVAPPPGTGLQRYYFAVAASARGRYSPLTAFVPAPLGPTSGPPSAPQITVNETSMTLRWTPPVDARGLELATEPDWLPARPVVPGPAATTYDIYEVTRNASPDGPDAMPTPLTPEPIAATEFTRGDIALGAERCFYVRAVDIIDGVHVRGPASPVACASFADTFAPTPPRELVAVGVPGGINLIWEPSEAADVAGYLVLRAEAGSATLTPLMTTPMATPSYRDETAKAGVRYVYAVVAVDKAGNRSAESNRVEETAP
jgi:hypothetical protein